MTELLIRLFGKKGDLNNPAVRKRYGDISGITGIVCNLILFGIKLFAGLITASFSILADAFNNLSDMGSSLITLIAFKLAAKPADKDHPFGHGRMEYIAAMVVSFAITLVGFELFKGSIEKIITPEKPSVGWLPVIILSCSILVKLWMAVFNRKLGNLLNSDALRATSQDSINDCLSTGAVLVATVLLWAFGINIDAYVGLAVAVFILFAGVKSVKDTIDPLLGIPAEKSDIENICAIVREMPYYQGIHDMIIHNYGPGKVFCSLHVEVPQTVDILSCHEEIDACEKRVLQELGIEMTIHMDPIAVDDPLTDRVRGELKEVLERIHPALMFHDLRLVKGERQINLIFDVVPPHEIGLSETELKNIIAANMTAVDKRYCCVITVDPFYMG